MTRYIVGCDVGGTKVAYGLFDEEHRLVDSLRVPSDQGLAAEAFTDRMIDTIRSLLEKRGGMDALGGVGLCLPSFIDYEARKVIRTANLPLFRDFAVCDYMEQRLGIPVAIDNDSNAAALAEHCYGAGKGTRNMLYCAISTGLGLGIIIDGRIFRGDNGMAGESGHMVADPERVDDFESHISGGHIVKRLAVKLREGEESVLGELCGGNYDRLTARHLLEAFRQGDLLAAWGVDHMAQYLGVWAYNLYMTFNINTYVFGGGLVNFGDSLLGRAHDVMDEMCGGTTALFKTAELGENFGIIGAAELISHL